ncbi:MAG: hypothetical protein HY248_03030, partial [Fimbriimonas ginsengisoli]|nr:hypothetical protein [Fimbriimonas ginsengisoli]
LELHGAIGGLAGTAPDQTFNLTFGNGMTVAVQTNAQTAIFNNDGSPNPVLGNGEHVELSGTFSAPDHVFVATRIRINVEAEDGGAEVFGTPSAIDSTAHTFDITVTEAEGLVPEASTIHVVVNATSRYFRGCGLSIGIDDFFTLLAADGAKVGAEGTFDATSNTLTALRLIVVPFGSSTELAEAKGTDSNVDAVAGTFDLTLSAFEGFNVAAGSTIHIATNGSTQFFGPDGAPIDKAAFFAGLAAAASVGVQGTWDATTQTITALRAKLITAEGAGFVFVEGTSSSVDSTAHTFSVTIFHWEDALLVSGETLSVVTNSSTVYKGADGVVITQDAFFAALAGGPVRVGVAGTLSGTTLTAAVARLLGG